MSEVTSKSHFNIAPNCDKRLVAVRCTSAANGDVLTLGPAQQVGSASGVAPLTVVEFVLGISTTGVPLTATITGSSNIITLVNGGALTWNILVGGY